MQTLGEFKHIHKGETIVVCGCGESLNLLEQPERFVTIGVNDVGRRFHPDYLVVVNPGKQFSGDRFRHVETSRARYLFSQYDDLAVPHPHLVTFKLGTRGGTDFSNPDVLHFTQNSPYIALCLAIHMGATRIGLIGVDFTEAHFFGKTGTHPMAGRLDQINREYGALEQACRAMGVELVNLSPVSRITALPKVSLSWVEVQVIRNAPVKEKPGGLQIVSYATTPVAGVPAILARCISAATEHSARCVWATNEYGNGVQFTGDVQWQKKPQEAMELLDAADLVIVHNGKVDPAHRRLLESKPVVTMAHNYGWNVDMQFVAAGQPGVVIGQYQATLPEFARWSVVPNPIPLWEPEYQPGTKADQITIAFTPSGKHERYPRDHRLYWHGKGFETTVRILERLSRRADTRIESTAERQVSHGEALAMKRRAHIVIDECVTGSYHRNSLEGLATGCVVVNGVGLLDGVLEQFRHCANNPEKTPFVYSDLATLENVLLAQIESGIDSLSAAGLQNRTWMERQWAFAWQWRQLWEPVAGRAMALKNGAAIKGAAPAVSSLETKPGAVPSGVSVIIPHGGAERLPQLAAALAQLSHCPAVSEIIVVEMGEQGVAEEVARRWRARYLFIETSEVFERARALNVGSAIAEGELLLWMDNDLLLPAGFLEKAAQELHERQLDCLIPYTSIAYLAEADSGAVIEGSRSPRDCTAAKILSGGRDINGGSALVTKAFFQRYGGMSEEFLGWGGEDNFWVHKVTLLGRLGVTRFKDQFLYHLYHHNSGAHSGRPLTGNPHYLRNVALMNEARAIEDKQRFLKRFPPAGAKQAAVAAPVITSPLQQSAAPRVRNVFACLVHENQECVVDLVRNLRYLDPDSVVLLYNGGTNRDLLVKGFPFERHGAVVHPSPRPLKWGWLHDFALDCMSFSLANFSFDTLTIVDSDQLGIGMNYSGFLGNFLATREQVGMLGNSSLRQGSSTRIAPAMQAWKEVDLWRPFLRRFPGGEEKFVQWTFWPSTVFSVDAARELTRFFAVDQQLGELLKTTKIWASEEIILPTLIALFGFTILDNPCSYDFVKFRARYSTRQLESALNAPELFWVHPVPRLYNDPLRKYIRSRFHDYARQREGEVPMKQPMKSKPLELVLTTPILEQMRKIEGWLDDGEADLLIATSVRALTTLPPPHAVVEVGSYCGRSTVVLGAVVKALSPGAKIFAIDPHDGKIGALDQGVETVTPTLAAFRKNIAAAHLTEVVEIIQKCSYDVSWDSAITLLFIDGLHDYANVARDFYQFEKWVVTNGYIAFHDYADYYPGVVAFVDELLNSGAYRKVRLEKSMMVVEKLP
ncbi:MAG: class I SAM-dependent methyltransferase [Desulfuromonadaceae bacterium]|nr:class I SAM-dependent methyltransferase [Desulfuromonadaceae bacterium]